MERKSSQLVNLEHPLARCWIHVVWPSQPQEIFWCVTITTAAFNSSFRGPRGIAVHPHSKKIYIIDTHNHRVQILNSDLTLCSSFGSHGSENGNFNFPRCITFDSTGNVYIIDEHNHWVSVFTPSRDYIRHIGGRQGCNEGELNGPCSVAIDSNNVVCISEWENNRISMFTLNGEFIRCFGRKGKGPGEFNMPAGVAIDNNGKIYIADCCNYRVQIF